MLLRRMLIMVGLVILVVAALAGYKFWSIRQQIAIFSAPPPPISVSAITVEERDWQDRLQAIGSLRAFQGVDLTTEVSGTVTQVQFESGQKVQHNQPLITLSSDVEQASLATTRADLNLAQIEYARGQKLLARQVMSKSEYDRLAADVQKLRANVAQLEAQLAKKRIVAPFSGTIGIRQVDVGGYVSSGTTIATLQDLSRLYVDFFLPEQAFPQLALGQRVTLGVGAWPGQTFEGTISAINPKVDADTRNLQVRATLANPDGKLLPGMFANLEVQLPGSDKHIVVPETAISYTLYGNSVYVIDEKKNAQGEVEKGTDGKPVLVVTRTFVETGERRAGQVIVAKGLAAGQRLVTAGQLNLDNGSPVSIHDENVQASAR